MKEIARSPNCFVCGEKNIGGLKARFYFDGVQAFTEITTSVEFEGYHGIYHGGIVSTILDEVMIKAIIAIDRFAVTAEMTVRFLKPVAVGIQLKFTGRVAKNRGRVFHTEGEVTGDDGTVYARATGKYVEAKDQLRQQLVKSVD